MGGPAGNGIVGLALALGGPEARPGAGRAHLPGRHAASPLQEHRLSEYGEAKSRPKSPSP